MRKPSMERTPLREEFFRRASEDPYLSMIQKMWADAWVSGYEEALRDVITQVAHPREGHEIEGFRLSRSYQERVADALEYLTTTEQRAEALIALAALGTKMERLASEHIERLIDPRRIEMIG